MSYLALYRKYRPSSFLDVIGQDHIVKVLTNQIIAGKAAHAYLFTGSRGTGKTTCAKIFAKAVNCQNNDKGSPCGKCKSCKDIEGGSMDIIEIDAASNNGVDEIRDLRERVKYRPASVQFRVYIIDEVHMLSTAAFNALLKTLEEPPEHAIFILATTDPQKLPATILSRCLKFDFHLVSEKEIEGILKKIFIDQGKEVEPEAVAAIARAGEGSVRDALSVADVCLSASAGKLTYGDVLSALGASDPRIIFGLADNIISGDIAGLLLKIDETVTLGKSVGILNKDLIRHFRDILIAITVQEGNKILRMPAESYSKLTVQGNTLSRERAAGIVEIFARCDNDMRYSAQGRLLFENACVRAATAMDGDTIVRELESIKKQIEELRKND